LKKIVADGLLIPSFAPRTRVITGGSANTIQGSNPAVCFTEQPLDSFITSCNILPDRYKQYGVAVHKWHLYTYGGRPVIYGDQNVLKALPDGKKYLWVGYNPIPNSISGGYPIDWMHEREWRSAVRNYHYLDLGMSPEDGVPLLLPGVQYPNSNSFVLALPRFIVRTLAEQRALRTFIESLPPYDTESKLLREYRTNLVGCGIIPLEEVEARLPAHPEYARLETIPLADIDDGVALPAPETFL
jgi:hypothetical protein